MSAMDRRTSGSGGGIVDRSVEHKAKVFSQPASNTYVDTSVRLASNSHSPKPYNGRYERYQSRSRSRSPYRHPTSPRGEKRPRDSHSYRDEDRVDSRRFRVHYDEDRRPPQMNGRHQVSYADIDKGESDSFRGGRDKYNDGRQNRAGRAGNANNRGRSDRRGRDGQYDRYGQGSYGNNGNRNRGGYTNGQNGGGYNNGQNGGYYRNSREPSMGQEGHNGWQNDGSRRNSRDLSVSNRGDTQQHIQNFRSPAENHPRHSQQETAKYTVRNLPAKGVDAKLPGDAISAPPTIDPPEDPDIDYDNLPVVDEDAEIAKRRAKRAALLAKTAAKKLELPLIQQALLGSTSGPDSPAIGTPADGTDRSVSPATPGAGTPGESNATNSPAVFVVNANGGPPKADEEYSPLGEDDGPSAADYDPTVDQAKDRLRAEQQTIQKIDDGHDSKDDVDMFADTDSDDDDMFAAETPVKTRRASSGATKPQLLGENMMSKWVDQENYYVIRVGELVAGRYVVEQELGKGMFSGVIRATDLQTKGRMVAIKIIRKNDTMKNIGQKEIRFLEKVNAADPSDKKHIVRYFGQFDHKKHLCLVFENLDMNVREVLKKYGGTGGLALEAVKAFARQIFIGLDFLHKQELIHADFKPDNLLVNDTHKGLKICDLGSACEPHETLELGDYLVSRFYRAPEIILGGSITSAIDIWAAGCTLFELWTGEILFRGDSNNQMLRAMMEVRGKFPLKQLKKGEKSGRYFNDDESFVSIGKDPMNPGKRVSKTLVFNKPYEKRSLRDMVKAAANGLETQPDAKELIAFTHLLEKCLDLKWEKRISAADALKHEWFKR